MRRRHHECGEMTEGIYHQRSYKTKEFLLEDREPVMCGRGVGETHTHEGRKGER